MRRQLFVWSLAPGPHAGDPCEPTAGQREAAHRPRESGHPAQGPLEVTGTLVDVFDELSHGRLRCGWGVAPPALAGRVDTPRGGQPAGASAPEPSHAVGGRHASCGLREMAVGDVVFLPKSPDDGHFMVATVQRPAAGDHAPGVDAVDERHACRQVLGVAETMRYAYGGGTLYPDLLEAPRREAIQRIAEDHPSYPTLAEFLQSWGR
jgi:hypothetical protein